MMQNRAKSVSCRKSAVITAAMLCTVQPIISGEAWSQTPTGPLSGSNSAIRVGPLTAQSRPAPPDSIALPQPLDASPAASESDVTPPPAVRRISIPTDQLPLEVGKGPRIGRYYLNKAEEDFSYLADPKRSNDLFDHLKFIPLNDDKSVYLTLNGEERLRNEIHTKNSFSFVPPTHNDLLLLRHEYGADLHLGPHVRGYLEVLNGSEAGQNVGFAPAVNRTDFAVQQGFVELSTGLDVGGLEVGTRVGRQEFLLGSLTNFSKRDPTNIGITFDGFRGWIDNKALRVDAFAFDAVINRTGALQDSTNAHQQVWGVYGSHPLPVFSILGTPSRLFIDPYYYGYQNRNSAFNTFRGNENRSTFGGRLWGEIGGADLDWSGSYQSGNVGPAGVSAFSLTSDTGYTFNLPMAPRIGGRFDVFSGGREGNTLHTYNPLYPATISYSEAGLLNSINLIDVQLGVSFSPTKRLRVLVYDALYWKYALNDAIYSTANIPFRNTTRSRSTAIGQQPAIRAGYFLNEHVILGAAVAFFRVDAALRDAGAKNNLYAVQQVTFRF